ncbi:hypothetical protein [Amycolatopsis anabasis]|uniref:hypothetical protein n=1 Tax=Amycolatopsis anabasis TaxID=1840409 RepID=UPI00131AAE3A|nr:hypothetical protein [Amycolatopsis anabasis]
MTTNDAPDPASTLADAQRRWRSEPPITLTMPRGDAWLLLTAAQLRRRDFDIAYNLVEDLHRVGRVIQDAVCTPSDPDLYRLAEAGWNPASDTALASGEHTQHTTRYAYLIDDSHNGDTWVESSSTDDRPTAGVEQVHDLGPADYARRVLTRWFAQLHRDDSYDWQDDSWFRCSIWDIDHSMDYRWGRRPAEPAPELVARWLKANGCAPHAVEVRTPTQAARDIEGSHHHPAPAQ